MKKWKKKEIILGLVVFTFRLGLLFSYNFFSPLFQQEHLNVSEPRQEFQLLAFPIIIGSEVVAQDSLTYTKDRDYTIDYQTGKFVFFQPVGSVQIEYKKYPEGVQERFFLYEEQEYSPDKKVKMPAKTNSFFSSTAKLQISGSKTISVSVANNEDFSLDQSLFLKIDGELSDNLNIEAQLSDSQSPITPEGDSREISSLDKVFMRLYSRRYELAFGDLEVDYHDTEFMNYAPKFEGLKATWQGRNQYQAALAISKGKTTTTQFYGVEAKQGPYYLTVESGEVIRVVAGTEKVFLNGSALSRGDDYTIDYSEGSITFSGQHFLSASSLIQVTFQYSDEEYRQNMYLASGEINVTDRFAVRNYLIMQSDDKDNPLQEEFTADDLQKLKAAGDNTVWGSGVSESEDGDYILTEEGYYQYVGNDSTVVGAYDVHFEYIGTNEGDYDYEDDDDYYVYVGEDQGEYLPIRQLIPAQKKENHDLIAEYKSSTLQAQVEAIYTNFDQNTFSSSDDDDNEGVAANFALNYQPDLDLLNPELSTNYRLVGEHLHTFAELSDPLANYESVQIPDSLENQTWNAKLSFNIKNFWQPSFKFATTRAPDYASQNYFAATSGNQQSGFFPALKYQFARLDRDYESTQTYDFDQHDLNGSYQWKKLQFEALYHHKKSQQKWEAYRLSNLNENWKVTVKTRNISQLSSEIYLKEEYQKTKIDTAAAATTDETSYTAGVTSGITLGMQSVKIKYSHREIFDHLADDQTTYDMAEISTRNSVLKNAVALSSGYAFQNVEFYPKIKELEYVGEGMGSYDEDSLYVGLGEGDYDWEIVEIDYDHPEMSVEVNANLNLSLMPSALTNSFLKKLKTETNLQITENSKAANKTKIYLLDPDILMNDETTLYGNKLMQHTLWCDLMTNKLNAKLRYKLENTLDSRYNDESETTDETEWEAAMRWNTGSKTSFEYTFESSVVEESQYESYSETVSHELEMRNQVNDDVNLVSALTYGDENGHKSDETNNYTIYSYQVTETVTCFLQRKYRLYGKINMRRNNRRGSEFLSFFDDKKDGTIFKWNLNLDYKMSSITSARLEYTGKRVPDEKTEHEIRLEIKAEF